MRMFRVMVVSLLALNANLVAADMLIQGGEIITAGQAQCLRGIRGNPTNGVSTTDLQPHLFGRTHHLGGFLRQSLNLGFVV